MAGITSKPTYGDAVFFLDFLELWRYLGEEFNPEYCDADDQKIHTEAAKYATNDEFVRDTMVFAYQNIGLLMQGIHHPFIARLLEMCTNHPMPSVIDVFAGGGQLGLALHTLGFQVSFTDLDSRSLDWLRWRLDQRDLLLSAYSWDTERDQIPLHDFAVCFDVLEHLTPQEQRDLLERLSNLGRVVLVNLIVDRRPEMAHVHLEVDPVDLIQWIKERWTGITWPYFPDEMGEPRQWLVAFGKGLDIQYG